MVALVKLRFLRMAVQPSKLSSRTLVVALLLRVAPSSSTYQRRRSQEMQSFHGPGSTK